MIRVNLRRPVKYEAVNFTEADLKKIGAKAIELVRNRCARGQNLRDKNAKRLSPKWAKKKADMGQPPIRNMMFSGSMLGAMTLVELNQNHVTVGFTRQAELNKAGKNQDRDPWFGLSKSDEDKLLLFADRILKGKSL
jgi:hypothetical protein